MTKSARFTVSLPRGTPGSDTSSPGRKFLVLVLLLVALAPGCILTSAANRLSDPTYPEQDASIASIGSDAVHVLVRAKDGSAEERHAVDTTQIGAVQDAKVELRWHRTQAFSPFAIFDPRDDERGYELEVKAVEPTTRKRSESTFFLRQIAKPPSMGAKAASYALMPFCFVVDVATFPIEWLLFPVVAR